MKRTFCIVTETFTPEINGVALTLKQKVDLLIQRGHTLQVIRPRQDADKTATTESPYPELLVHGLPIPGYAELRFGLPCFARIHRFWQLHRPDAVYIATEGLLGRSALKAAKTLQIPVISGFHTNFHQYSRHYHVGWLEGLIVRYLRHFHNHTFATLVPTFTQMEALKQYGITNTALLGRGIDNQRFSPKWRSERLRQQWGLDADDLAVIHVGRLAAEKNIALAITAFARIKQYRSDARFILVGDGPIASVLKSKHPEFIFCGMQTGHALAEHYASADLMLFPSKTETFGNVLLEGLASGLALACFDYASGKQHLTHKISGMLSPFNDDQHFCLNALELATDNALRQQIATQAHQVAQSIGWPQIIGEFEGYLEQAIADNALNREGSTGEIINEP